jgi:hypothetical protein
VKIANKILIIPSRKFLSTNKASETTDPELIRYALMGFVTHHSTARKKNLRIPLLVKRAPGASVPKKKKISLAPGPVVSAKKS